MKKLHIVVGGMPFTGRDLLFMQDALREAVHGVANAFATSSNAVLSQKPLSIAGNQITWLGCWVLIAGDLRYCPQQIVNGNPEDYAIYKKDDEYDPAGQDVFEDGLTKETYLIQDAEILPIGTGTGDYIKLSDVHTFTPRFTTTGAHTIVETPENRLKLYREGNQVTIQGFVTDGLSYTIPEQFRPIDDIRIPGHHQIAFGQDVQSHILLTVDPSGSLIIGGDIPAGSKGWFTGTYFV